MRVAINGFGRIGRAVFRIAESRDEIEIVAINDLFDHAALGYLLTYDTVMGRFDGQVVIEEGQLVTTHSSVRMLKERDPTRLPWDELGVDIVVESTGVFQSRDEVAAHLKAGARRALLTVPAKDAIDYTVVLGVNEDGLRANHRIVSNASCTTNCLAPVAKVLDDSFGMREGVINTVHAYTNDQSLADVPHSDWRRSRAAAENTIPTSTGAAKAVGKVLPALDGRLHASRAEYRSPTARWWICSSNWNAKRRSTRFTMRCKELPLPLGFALFWSTQSNRSCRRTLSEIRTRQSSTPRIHKSPAAASLRR